MRRKKDTIGQQDMRNISKVDIEIATLTKANTICSTLSLIIIDH